MSEQVKKKKKTKYFFDYTMLFIVLFLLLFGLVMLYSTSSYEANIKFEDSAFYFKKQAVASAIGIAFMLGLMLVDYHMVQRFAALAYVVSLVLILLVLTPLGYEAGGARRWLNLGMSLQPAEVAKLALDRLDVDSLGLDNTDRNILETMIYKFNGGPVGLDTLAAAIGEDSGTLEDVYEPYLIKNGFINRTPRGRIVTEHCYKHFGLENLINHD